eukprot:1158131-Pelagomonas_calceolata.AAC.4
MPVLTKASSLCCSLRAQFNRGVFAASSERKLSRDVEHFSYVGSLSAYCETRQHAPAPLWHDLLTK